MYMQRRYEHCCGLYIHAPPHFFFGVGFVSALDPERPFSVLSIPDDVTRHSLLQRGVREREEDSVRRAEQKQPKETRQETTPAFTVSELSEHAAEHQNVL